MSHATAPNWKERAEAAEGELGRIAPFLDTLQAELQKLNATSTEIEALKADKILMDFLSLRKLTVTTGKGAQIKDEDGAVLAEATTLREAIKKALNGG